MKLPIPELYVVYTGDKKTKPDKLSLNKDFFGGVITAIDVEVKVIYLDDSFSIISQYILFTKILKEQLKANENIKTAIRETIRLCKDRGILKEYLENRESEVERIMYDIYDQETMFDIYVREKYAEGQNKGLSQGLSQGRKEQTYSIGKNLKTMGLSITDIIKATGLTQEQIKNL